MRVASRSSGRRGASGKSKGLIQGFEAEEGRASTGRSNAPPPLPPPLPRPHSSAVPSIASSPGSSLRDAIVHQSLESLDSEEASSAANQEEDKMEMKGVAEEQGAHDALPPPESLWSSHIDEAVKVQNYDELSSDAPLTTNEAPSWREFMPVSPPLPRIDSSHINPLSDQDKGQGLDSSVSDIRPSVTLQAPLYTPSDFQPTSTQAQALSDFNGLALKKLWRPQDMMKQQLAMRGIRSNTVAAKQGPSEGSSYWADVDQSFSTVSPNSSAEFQKDRGITHTIEIWRRRRQALAAGINIQDPFIQSIDSSAISSHDSTP